LVSPWFNVIDVPILCTRDSAFAARRSRALECGSLLPLLERSRQDLSESGGKPPHSKAALRAAEP
jgi:hypothetical protein